LQPFESGVAAASHREGGGFDPHRGIRQFRSSEWGIDRMARLRQIAYEILEKPDKNPAFDG